MQQGIDSKDRMPSRGDKQRRAGRRGLVALLLAIAAVLGTTGNAFAGQDDLKGGSVVMQLQGSRGLKLKPGNITLSITGGAVDPVNGAGTAQVSGGFTARRGKGKAKVKITTFNLSPNGGRGSIVAKVGKDFVNGFGTLSGGTITRDGWGAKIENITATIAGPGAKALNKAFRGKTRKGAKKSARAGVKAGQPLGRIATLTTVPSSVEVVAGTGTMELATNLGGAFASKLPQHCISLTGVTAIAPAMMELLPVGGFTFPVAGGSAAPDFTAGQLLTAGGQTLTKDNGLGTPSGCSAGPPVGTHLLSTDLGVDFAQNALTAIATLPSGTALPRAPLATIDFSTGTRSVDPNTKTLTVTGATASLASLAAPLLNQNFPNESGSAANDFAAGDEIGTINITGAKLR
jgi:hypothetical protein